MALTISQINNSSTAKALMDKIIAFGKTNGFDDVVIVGVLHIGNQESAMGTAGFYNAGNPKRAWGEFQFNPYGGSDAKIISDFQKDNPSSVYATWTVEQFKASTPAAQDARIATMFDAVQQRYYSWSYDQHLLGGTEAGYIAFAKSLGAQFSAADSDLKFQLVNDYIHFTDPVASVNNGKQSGSGIIDTNTFFGNAVSQSGLGSSIPRVTLQSGAAPTKGVSFAYLFEEQSCLVAHALN